MGRALTDRERDVIAFMIHNAGPLPGDEPLSAQTQNRLGEQLLTARAGQRCGCGTCPSIEIEDQHGHTPTSGPPTVLTAGTAGATVLLFIDHDRLGYLELAPHTDDVTFPVFPPVTALNAWMGPG